MMMTMIDLLIYDYDDGDDDDDDVDDVMITVTRYAKTSALKGGVLLFKGFPNTLLTMMISLQITFELIKNKQMTLLTMPLTICPRVWLK